MNSIKNFFRKHGKIFAWIGGILVALVLIGVVVSLLPSDGFIGELKGKTRNEANLIVYDDDYEDLDGKYSGIDVKINADGSITLDGEADEDVTLTLLTDADGFGSEAIMALGPADFGEDAEGAYIGVYNGDTLEASSYEGETVFISSGATAHTVKLFIPEGAELDNVTVYPMLNYGVTAASYFKIVQ